MPYSLGMVHFLFSYISFIFFKMNDNIAVNRKEKFCGIALFSKGYGFSIVHLFAW